MWKKTSTMTSPKILIVEDEPKMVIGLRDNFQFEGYQVLVANDGEAGIECAIENKPDLVILDLMLPKLSGLDVCRRLRSRGFSQPILMLTARGQEIDKVVGLEVGADDYITKPFSIKELIARIRAHLRRAGNHVVGLDSFEFAGIRLNFRKYEATKAGQKLQLSAREFALLQYFVLHQNETVTRDQLLNEVWGYDSFPNTRTVDNHIAKLRQKIEDDAGDPKFILTVHGVGYRFTT